MKAVVFDIGGTLMEYKNMPYSWVGFYKPAFEQIRDKFVPDLSDEDIQMSVERLKFYNPRLNYREKDFTPEVIFADATAHWKCDISVSDVINEFFSSINLTAYIYPETNSVLEKLREDKYVVAAFTDVASAMPDELHKSYFTELMPYFDMYVSSVTCGYRKPNPKGLQEIAEHFGLCAEEMIFIGDEEKDIAAAKRFGCHSVFVDRRGERPDFGQNYTVTDLNGLSEVLQCENDSDRL